MATEADARDLETKVQDVHTDRVETLPSSCSFEMDGLGAVEIAKVIRKQAQLLGFEAKITNPTQDKQVMYAVVTITSRDQEKLDKFYQLANAYRLSRGQGRLDVRSLVEPSVTEKKLMTGIFVVDGESLMGQVGWSLIEIRKPFDSSKAVKEIADKAWSLGLGCDMNEVPDKKMGQMNILIRGDALVARAFQAQAIMWVNAGEPDGGMNMKHVYQMIENRIAELRKAKSATIATQEQSESSRN